MQIYRENLQYITDLVYLVRDTDPNCALSVLLQVQTSWCFLATNNSFHQVEGDCTGIHKSTSCKAVQDFCKAVCRRK